MASVPENTHTRAVRPGYSAYRRVGAFVVWASQATKVVIVLAVVQLLRSKMRQTRRAVSRPLLAVLLLRARKPIETAGENTCSPKRASCLGNSRREREAFSSMLSAARSTREARYEQMCHLLSHQRRLEAETPTMRRGKHV